MKGCLAAGYPFVFGFAVYESFESKEVAQSGVVPMPKPGERVLGGHAVMAVGYDDAQRDFIVRNSWGSGWGQDGYFLMPYHYLHDPNLAVRLLDRPDALRADGLRPLTRSGPRLRPLRVQHVAQAVAQQVEAEARR